MRLTVKLWGPLAKYAGAGTAEFIVDVPAGTTVDALIGLLGVPAEYVLMAAVNGTKSERDRVLRDGDVVHVLPLVAGG
ncbi:MoaD/ThiS family protein [Desulforudis sp. 1088]|uniref:MoaD/ThiS family protein n=1 Tax=unclassified Candidatus Desulforudis TaxID=2635950 RepID=UPI00346EAC52